MKIGSGSSVGKTTSLKRSQKSQHVDKVFAVRGSNSAQDEIDDVEATDSLDNVYANAGVSALLALQETQFGVEENKQAYEYGNALLHHLRQLQNELLAGKVSGQRLQAIARFIQAQRGNLGQDLRLREIIVQIETRMHVEAAKYGQSLAIAPDLPQNSY